MMYTSIGGLDIDSIFEALTEDYWLSLFALPSTVAATVAVKWDKSAHKHQWNEVNLHKTINDLTSLVHE